jgi:hypothetical protein
MAKFQKGQSGNPNGRPRGARNKKTLLMEALVEGKAEAIVEKAVEMATNGDSTLIRLCLDRIWPARKERCVPFALPALRTAADAMKAAAEIAAAVAAGALTPGEAEHLSGFVANYLKALDAVEFERRLSAAEADVKSVRA